MHKEFPQCDISRCLADAGCSKESIAAFLEYMKDGRRDCGIKVLTQQRGIILEDMHREQKKLECIDYLIYKLKTDDTIFKE